MTRHVQLDGFEGSEPPRTELKASLQKVFQPPVPRFLQHCVLSAQVNGLITVAQLYDDFARFIRRETHETPLNRVQFEHMLYVCGFCTRSTFCELERCR